MRVLTVVPPSSFDDFREIQEYVAFLRGQRLIVFYDIKLHSPEHMELINAISTRYVPTIDAFLSSHRHRDLPGVALSDGRFSIRSDVSY